MSQKFIDKMTGYKATNADLTCQGFQFEIGKWHEIEGEIKLCKRGFHFCIHASGPSCYYDGASTRVFKIEAEQVLEVPTEAGADFKLVSKRIKLVEEITPGKSDKSNTGDSNTGYRNTGNCNTGYRNTGNCNTGDRNTGNCNTGNCNTGNCNTGYRTRATGTRATGTRATVTRATGTRATVTRATVTRATVTRATGHGQLEHGLQEHGRQ